MQQKSMPKHRSGHSKSIRNSNYGGKSGL
jgi:hypothetical protein